MLNPPPPLLLFCLLRGLLVPVLHKASFRELCFEGILIDSRIFFLFIPLQKWKFIVYIFTKADGFFPLKGVSTHDLEDKLIKEKKK